MNSTQPQLDEYQKCFVRNVRRVIEMNWWQRRPMIRILDMGCDTSGRQMASPSILWFDCLRTTPVPSGSKWSAATDHLGLTADACNPRESHDHGCRFDRNGCPVYYFIQIFESSSRKIGQKFSYGTEMASAS